MGGASSSVVLSMRVSMLIIIIVLILSLHVTGLEAKEYYGGRKMSMQKKTRMNSNSILRELGYDHDLAKMEMKHDVEKRKTRRRLSEDRVAPGGPDPQHNYACPPALRAPCATKSLDQKTKCRNTSDIIARRC